MTPKVDPDFARLLQNLEYSPSARCFYDLMSGALMWEDEKGNLPHEELGWFRAVLAYRSSMLLASPLTEFETAWNTLRQISPAWPGFRPERCTSTPDLVERLQNERKRLKRNLERCEATNEGEWKPLSGRPTGG